MTKRRRKRKKRSRGKPTSGKSVSSTARKVGERIATADAKYLQDNFIRIMEGSVDLRQEPEFADFYFEPRPLLEAAARHSPWLSKRLYRAARRNGQDVPLVYDDYRIKVLNDLDTPQLRQQLQSRAQRCINRLQHGHDAHKIESALFLSAFLSNKMNKIVKGNKSLPLGMYALVTTIYEDSIDRAMETIPGASDIVGDELYRVWCARHTRKDLAVITAATEQIDNFQELAVHLETDRALARAWERQELLLIEDLESKMAYGLNIELGLFTPEQIALAMTKMERRYWNKPWSLSRYFILLAVRNFANCIRETLDEIVSPQKIAETITKLELVGQKCLETGEERWRALAPNIQAAIYELQRAERPSQSRVVRLMYTQGFLAVAQNTETLGPHWQRFFKRMRKSRLWRRLDIADL